MSNQLRYLLHGNKDKYQDVTTPLYITSQESTVWQKVGKQALQIKGEDWRLIDSVLVDYIPANKRQTLGIKLLQSEEVVELIRELGIDCVDCNLLEPSERYELLRYLRQKPINQELWKALQIHETINGELVAIESGKMYLENPDFPLAQALQEHIILIRQNQQEIDQNWIPLWTPDQSIKTILNLHNPHQYCNLILDAIQKLSVSEKTQWETDLKNIHWLVDIDGNTKRPRDIIKLSQKLVQHQEIICKLDSIDSKKYTDSSLPDWIKNHPAYSWLKKLFTFWNTQTVLEKVFSHSQRSLSYWRNFCLIILDALQDIDISDYPNSLKTEAWLLLDNGLISPEKVIAALPKTINKYLSTLVEISKGEYAELSLLSENIKNHDSLEIIKKWFTRWYENHVIEFILNQSQSHLHLDILLDTLNSLFSNEKAKLTDNNIQNLKIKPWLVDSNGNAVYSENVLHYPVIEIEIEELLHRFPSDYIVSSQLDPQIHNNDICWQWLTQELFVIADQALSKIGTILKTADDYQLGEFNISQFPLSEVLEVFNNIDVSFLPAWSFAQKLNQKEFTKYLLANLLGKLDKQKLTKILQNLIAANNQPDENIVKVFNSYLELAVNNHSFPEILGKIRLLNRRGYWQSPYKLTWGNQENIDSADLLNSEQEIIIQSYLKNVRKNNLSTALQSSEIVVDESNFDVLRNYFRTWEQHCPSEPIGAFLTLLYGGEGNVKNLAHLYLGKRDLGILRQRLFENQPIQNRAFKIYVGQASDQTREVQSIMGSTFKANLVNSQNPPHLFVSKLAPDITELELLPIQPQNFAPSQLVNLLKKSTKILLQAVYEVTPVSIEKIWQDLIESDQLDIQVAKNFLLEGAPYVMRMLGAHECIALVKSILSRWDDLRHQKAELKQQNRSVDNIDKQLEDLISGLSNLLENESSKSEEVREQLLEAVRAKIKLHGYQPQSIPFELFQNADDAVVEWQFMSPQQKLDDRRKKFIIRYDEKKIQFIHAGRPIGCFQHPDHPEKQYKDKGFDRDLEKMLTFNISDKAEGVTGKFGLGFKSVYLACRKPYVLSKNLGFTVEGGLIPSRLNPQKASELRGYFESYIGLSDTTIIELNFEENLSYQNVLQDFQSVVNILLVFSRAIKTCIFFNHQHQTSSLSWHPTSVLDVPGVEIGKYQSDNDIQNSLLLCFKTNVEGNASLVLSMQEQNGRIRNALPEKTPTFWVTAPTKERLFLGFVLNANFDITTGRESLVKSSVRNRVIAQNIGEELGKILYSLFCKTNSNWQDFTDAFGFIKIDQYEFWNFLWEELAVTWQQKDASEGIDIIRHILAGNNCMMGYLITHCSALPNGLYGSYRQLIFLNDVRYKVIGTLSEQSTFLQVAKWPGYQQQYKHNLIASDKWREVKKLLGEPFVQQNYNVTDLRLVDVLKNEIGNQQPRVGVSQARYLGSLIDKDFLNNLTTDYEIGELQSFLETVHFMSKAGSYLPCQHLLISNANAMEEKLLVDFAPDNRILHPDYMDSALNFFYACRSRRDSISKEEIISWVLQVTTEEKRKAVHIYLLQGEQREEIAPALYANRERSWFANDKSIIDILECRVIIADEKASLVGETIPIDIEDFIQLETISIEEIESYNPLFEIYTNCVSNDFSLERTAEEVEEFADKLQAGINRQNSVWKGYIYHFTHVENAFSILTDEKLLARNLCGNFKDSAGGNLIAHTREDIKNFARFYLRPKTPTQWHNEGLGKRRGDIYAFCPVPIFFRFNMKKVLETHGSKCAISSGNLASASSHYGNSAIFLEQYFDFDYLYSELQQVGKETFLKASQQEFIVHNYLTLSKLDLEDVSIICRTEKDKETLLNLLGSNSKYASRIFEEQEIVGEGSLFYNNNPYVSINDTGSFIDIQIDNYDLYGKITGELMLNLADEHPFNHKIISPFKDISMVNIGEHINVSSYRHFRIQKSPNTRMSVRFQENGQEWLIYTNEY